MGAALSTIIIYNYGKQRSIVFFRFIKNVAELLLKNANLFEMSYLYYLGGLNIWRLELYYKSYIRNAQK